MRVQDHTYYCHWDTPALFNKFFITTPKSFLAEGIVDYTRKGVALNMHMTLTATKGNMVTEGITSRYVGMRI